MAADDRRYINPGGGDYAGGNYSVSESDSFSTPGQWRIGFESGDDHNSQKEDLRD